MQEIVCVLLVFFNGQISIANASPTSSFATVMEKTGPTTVQQFCKWPQRLLNHLLQNGDGSDGLRTARIHALFSREVLVYSDYSGMAGEYEFLFQIENAMQSDGIVMDANIKHHRVCDHSKIAQTILKQISDMEFSEMCVFNDINDRLPKHCRDWLDAAGNAYESMQTYLDENREIAFAGPVAAHCVAHSRDCNPFPEEPDPSSSQSLRLNFAGTTCRGWSAAGKNGRFSDPSERPHAIWLMERKYRASKLMEDAFFSECTPRYPVEDMGDKLDEIAEFITNACSCMHYPGLIFRCAFAFLLVETWCTMNIQSHACPPARTSCRRLCRALTTFCRWFWSRLRWDGP